MEILLNGVHDSAEVISRRVAACTEHAMHCFFPYAGFLRQALERDVSMHQVSQDRECRGFVSLDQATDGLGIECRRIVRIYLTQVKVPVMVGVSLTPFVLSVM